MGQAVPATAAMLASPAFVTIKFDRPNVSYREALAQAVSTAKRRKSDTAFDIVGVSPGRSATPEATARAQEVANTLTTLGVDPTKIRLYNAANTAAQTPEVRIYGSDTSLTAGRIPSRARCDRLPTAPARRLRTPRAPQRARDSRRRSIRSD